MGTKTGAKRRKKGPKGPFSRPAERSCGSSPAMPDELRRLGCSRSSDHVTAGTGSHLRGVSGSSPAKYRNNNLRHTANEYGLCLFLSPLARRNTCKIMKYNKLERNKIFSFRKDLFPLFRPCPKQFDRAPEHRSVGRIHHPIEAFAREKPLGDQCLDLQFQEPV